MTTKAKKKRERRRYKDGEARARPGKPPTPPHLSPHYRKQTLSLPKQGWDNFDELADLGNAKARSGSAYGETSWRRMLHDFAMKAAPRIIAHIKAAGITFQDWDSIQLTIDLTQKGHGDVTTTSDDHLNERPGNIHDYPSGPDAETGGSDAESPTRRQLPGG